jgi:DNA repair exonuclease SbcCD ATPase subunit
MADEIKIDDIIDFEGFFKDAETAIGWVNKIETAIKQTGKADLSIKGIDGLRSLKDSLDQLTAANKVLASSIGSLDKVKKQTTDSDVKAAKASVENAKAKKIEAQASNETAKASLNEAKVVTETAKAKKIETQEREKAEKSQRSEQKLIDDIANDYKQLSLAYSEAALKAKNYAIRLGENHPVTLQAVKDAKDLKAFLDRIDQSTGDYRRNVGNYASAFNGLSFSMQQILREAPSLAINLNTFFLAISNNLPQFFDAIEQAKKANVDLAESGQKPVPVFQQIVKGLFSVQSALTIGITLITLYGTKIIDWFNDIGKGTGSIEKLKKQLASFNSEVKQSSEDLDLFFTYLDRLNKVPKVQLQIDNTNVPELQGMRNELQNLGKDAEEAQQKLSLSLDQFTKANEVRGKIENRFFSQASKEAIEAFNNGSIDKIKDKLPERDKILFEALQEAKTNFTKADEQIADLKTTLDVTNKNIDLKTAEIAKQSGEEARTIALDNATAIYNITKTNNDAVLANDRSTLKERLNALRSNFEAEKSLINSRKVNVLQDPTASASERNSAIKQSITDEKRLRSEFYLAINKEQEEFRLRDLEATKSIFVRQKELQANALKELSDNLEFSLQDRLQFQRNYSEAQKQILEAEYKQRLKSAGLSDTEIAAFEKDKNYRVKSKKITDTELLNLANEYESQALQLSIDSNKEITDNLRKELKKQQDLRKEDIDEIERLFNGIDLNTSKQYAEDVIALNESLNKKEISITAYQKRRKDIENKYSKEIINNTIDEILTQIRVFDGAEARLSASEIKLASLRNKFDNAKTSEEKNRISQEISVAKDEYDVAKDLVDKKIQLEKGLTDAKKNESEKRKQIEADEAEAARNKLVDDLGVPLSILQAQQTIGNAAFDTRMQQISEEMAALEERYNREKELIDQTVTNEIEKKQKLAEADARFRGQRATLEQRERQEKRNKALLDKQIAIFSIIINTARAVAEALPNIPKAVATGIVGAAELAVAIRAPIPKVFKGKNIGKSQSIDNYEGPAIVDEGHDGRGNAPEMIIRENGRIEIGSNKPRITYLNKNDIVLPAQMTKDALLHKSFKDNKKALTPVMVNNTPIIYHDPGAERRHKELAKIMKQRRENHYHGLSNRDLIMKYGYDVIKKI